MSIHANLNKELEAKNSREFKSALLDAIL